MRHVEGDKPSRNLSKISGAIQHGAPAWGIIRLHLGGIERDGPERHDGNARRQRPHQQQDDRDVVGGEGVASGRFRSETNMGAVKIGGTVIGGEGDQSGMILAAGNIASVFVGKNTAGDSSPRSSIRC